MFSLLWNMNSRYLKHPLGATSFSTNFIVPLVISLVRTLHFMYYVLLRLILNPCDFYSCLCCSNLAFILSLVSSTKAMSLENNMNQDTTLCIDRAILCRTIAKRKGLIVETSWRPIVIEKSCVAPPHVLIFVFTSRYLSCTIFMYFLGIVVFVIAYQCTSLGSLFMLFRSQ